MARIAGITDHTVKIIDGLGGEEILMTFRLPTTSERVKFRNEVWSKSGKKLINKQFEVRVKYGLKILTSIPNKFFGRLVNGQVKYISSDLGHPDYEENWRDTVAEAGADILEALALHVFERSAGALEAGEDEESEDSEADATPEAKDEENLEKN